MKENDGRGRRAQMHRAVGFSVAVVAFLTLVGHLVSSSSSSNDNNNDRNNRRRKWAHVESRHWASHDTAAAASAAGSLRTKRQSPQAPVLVVPEGGRNDKHESNAMMQDILDGRITLVDLTLHDLEINAADGTYRGAYGKFCRVAWQSHKRDPSTTPMFRDVMNASPDCSATTSVDLAKLMPKIRAYDNDDDQGGVTQKKVHTLRLGGVVFHESRCGSTLVANLLQAANPTAHRVYSESPPPVEVLKQGGRFDPALLSPLLRDVLELMSRSDDPDETTVFFKFQSISSRFLPVFTAAYPNTPWIFIHRDPVEILMSHFAHGKQHLSLANCARAYHRPPAIVQERLRQQQQRPLGAPVKPSYEEYCAAHLATLTESALRSLRVPGNRGQAVDYTQLPELMWTEILPHLWGIPLSADDVSRMSEVASQYSKGRGTKAGDFEEDTARKQEAAWEEVHVAARAFLADSYSQLHELSLNMGSNGNGRI